MKHRIIELGENELPQTFTPQKSSRERYARWTANHPGIAAERKRAYRRSRTTKQKIAVLDLETDPFDPINRTPVYPFLAILYSDCFDPIIRWNEDWRSLVAEIKRDIEALPDRFIIYAHNGGRFDYMFFIHELRGQVVFKGRSLMSAKIGQHELRDSFHILPEKLQAIGGKDEIAYSLFTKQNRRKFVNRNSIINYCLADCRYLFDSVMAFRKRHGSPITIGQAAMAELKRYYHVDKLDKGTDEFLRGWFFGGRVECFRYGIVQGSFNLFDVNSMYPFVMAQRTHPISNEIFINNRIREGKTAFLTIRCNNNGALVSRAENGSLTTGCRFGIFNTTIHEYELAFALGLISNVEILRTVEFKRFGTFEKFVLPIYERRQLNKQALDNADKSGIDELARKNLRYAVLFDKLLLNNAYGKFAQNPRRFKDYLITGCDEIPEDYGKADDRGEWGRLPEVECDEYRIWCRPSPEFRFNNVATAASITGAARAELLGAMVGARDVLYCDTDSIICSHISDSVKLDKFELGAWDCEASLNTFIGNGKKLYAYEKIPTGQRIIKAKGMNGVTWEDMVALSKGQQIEKQILAPTIGKNGEQVYITRNLSATGVL